jgi:hypothetical protein
MAQQQKIINPIISPTESSTIKALSSSRFFIRRIKLLICLSYITP